MDVQMTMNFLWVFCLAIGLVKSAPVEGKLNGRMISMKRLL